MQFKFHQPIALPSAGREAFLYERYSTLTDVEQSMVLASLLDAHGARPIDLRKSVISGAPLQIENAVRICAEGDAQSRLQTFGHLISTGCQIDAVTRLILDSHRNYFPGLLAALNAVYEGEEIGLLTARGNRRAHTDLIDAIQGFIRITIPRRNIYFVNDGSRNSRLGIVSTAEKKLQILRDFANGFYRDADGQLRSMSRRYEKVFFYDDERKNINTVTAFATANGLTDRLIAVNAPLLSVSQIWASLITKVAAGVRPEPGRKNVIHFFDIDGTLIRVDAKMYVVNAKTGERLLTISQEDLAEEPSVPFWISKAHGGNPNIPLELLEMDFRDFGDLERVRGQVQAGRYNNAMFKRGPAGHGIRGER